MSTGTTSHHGSIVFRGGQYERVSGTRNWKVWPIEAFDPPIRAPVGQVRIDFAEPLKKPYTVVVSAWRTAGSPLLGANYGDVDERGFSVHIWETVADRTLQNGNFSFAVFADAEES